MKKFLVIVFMGLLTGCASINYSDIENSEATVSNIKVVELGEVGTDEHQLDVKFDYSITNYHDTFKLYTCSVLFANSQDELVTTSKKRNPCVIDAKNGSISVKWDSPLSTSAGYSKQALGKLVFPIKFYVAIHQKKSRNTNIIIGKSDALFLSPTNISTQ